MAKIWGIAIGAVAVILAFLTLTGTGHVIDLAVQHFMLFYAGVFALIGLCASVGAGLIATDRLILNPGHRVWVQSAHRAISFGALAFLIIHIVTEILARRAHAIDAVVPFLSPFRTFYIGLGTIASDLIVLLVITSIFRKRFTSHGKNVWGWRAIHYSSYAALVFGVWHGLLGGRPGKPYVDWSYGFVIAFVALGLAVRVLANSLRPRETLSAPPVAETAGSASAPVRAAAMLAQLSAARAETAAPMAALGGGQPGMALGGGPYLVPGTALLPTALPPTVLPPMELSQAVLPQTVLPQAMPPQIAPPQPGAGPGPTRVIRAMPAGSGFNDTIVEDVPVYESSYESPPPRYPGGPHPVSGPIPVVPSSTISGPLPEIGDPPGRVFARTSGPLPQVPGGYPTRAPAGTGGAYPGPRTGPVPRIPGEPSGGFRRPDQAPAVRAPFDDASARASRDPAPAARARSDAAPAGQAPRGMPACRPDHTPDAAPGGRPGRPGPRPGRARGPRPRPGFRGGDGPR